MRGRIPVAILIVACATSASAQRDPFAKLGNWFAYGERGNIMAMTVKGRQGLAVSGGVHTAGLWGAGDSCWVLWNLDEAVAKAIGNALRSAIPAAWALPFAVTDDAQRDLHAALARRSQAMNDTSGERP